MTSQSSVPLPERPNLEQLKKQAKSLLHAARAADTNALERFRLLPAFAGKSVAELGAAGLALHDAQSVIAREHGFESWNALREHVEERSLSFAAAVDEFVRCATGSAAARAMRLLALHPAIAHANLYTELVLGDAEAVRERLRAQPALATQSGGVQDWEPLLYVCHTCLNRERPALADGLVAIARELLDRGANPNAEYHWQWHAELPRTALWGALCGTNHLPLAETLLERGANPRGRRNSSGARTVGALQSRSERHSRRRAAVALSLELGGHSDRRALAAGARRRSEPCLESARRRADSCRRAEVGRRDDGAARATRRRPA
jgi:hypothetical protein